MRILLLFSFLAVAKSATIGNYFGTTNNDWTDDAQWQGSSAPTAVDEAWMNTDDTTCTIQSAPAAINKLIVARKATNVVLTVENDLTIGSLLFLGQYVYGSNIPAHGTVLHQKGRINVLSGEVAVGVSAQGLYHQTGGSMGIAGHLKIGRYSSGPHIVGHVDLEAGSMSCQYLSMNPYSFLELHGGVLRIDGNRMSTLQNCQAAGSILGTGTIRIRESHGRTIIYAVDASSAKGHPTFYGTTDDWFDPDNWQNAGMPTINDEVWLNTAGTRTVIQSNQVAMAKSVIVGRKKDDIELKVAGELYVGDEDATGVLFCGQYPPNGSGRLVMEAGSLVTVHGEVAIAVNGAGTMSMSGDAAMVVHGRFKAGRYNTATAVGVVDMAGTASITCTNFEINDYSTLEMSDSSTIIVSNTNQKSRIDGYVANGRLFSNTGTISVVYDGTTTTVSIIPFPPSSPPTPAPVAPTSAPTQWDVAGIMAFTEAQVGPIMPQLNHDATLRSFTQVPNTGVHPRIFFGPAEIPAIRARLDNTNSPMSVETMKQFEVYTVSMTQGRAAYNLLSDDVKKLPSGKQRISNAGLFDTSVSYLELKAGVTTNLASQSNTHRNALAGVMAIEAFYCVVWDGANADVAQRASDLAAAMDTWSQWAVANPSFGFNSRDLGGGQHMAFCYDMMFNFMTSTQQANVRKSIATMLWPEATFKAHLITPHAVQSNWVALNSFVSAMVMAIEGDVVDPVADNGWSNSRLSDYFEDIMQANYNFLTYGWYSTGDPYEGMGKNYQYNMMMTAYAKRGYNFFTHPNVQAYAFDFLVAQMQPFGHYVTIYDAIGGSGWDPELGGNLHKAVDIIGLKHAFPSHPAVNFAYRNFIESPYRDSNGDLVTQPSIDADKVSVRSTYENAFLGFLVMGEDYDATDTFETQNEDSRTSLTFAGLERGLITTNSDYTQDALELQFHVRQDMGGHTMADRNNFVLSGLGRVWFRLPLGYLYDTEWANGILINDAGIPITYLDGTKARQPALLAHIQDNALATFATGDSTYAYNTEWYWQRKLPDQDYTRTGFTPVTETYNDFRRSDNQIPHSYGDISFYDYPHWWEGGYLERNVKKTVNDMKQVYRLAGMVRGTHPYALIVDDLEKASGSANYKWIGQIPEDLTLLPAANYPAGVDATRDIVLMEPPTTGNRRLLIRVLNAEGSTPNGLFEFDETMTYYQWGNDRAAKRFILERVAQLPRFRVLLYPFRDGDTVPVHSIDANGHAVADWGSSQKDTFVFNSQTQVLEGSETVEITGLQVWRGGNALIDTNGQVEPNPIRN